MGRTWHTLALIAALMLWPGLCTRGLAAVPLCLRVEADAGQREGLRKLARAELQRHARTHKLVAEECEATLKVQLFVVDGVRHLTVRAGQEVPVRYTYRDRKDLAQRLSRAVALVLQHEPEYLRRDVARLNLLQRLAHDLRQRGHNRYSVELFQGVVRSGRGAVTVPGAGFALARGTDRFDVFARLYVAGSPQGAGPWTPVLRVMSGGDVGASLVLWPRSTISPYVALGVGVQLLSFEGAVSANSQEQDSLVEVGGAVSGRVGLRMFRTHDFNLDLFCLGYLPLFSTSDPDSQLMDAYTPSLAAGLAVGF